MRVFGNPKPTVAPPAPEPPAPAPLTRDDVKTMLSEALTGVGAQLAGSLSELRAGVEALASRQPQVVVAPSQQVAPAAVPISDEEIDQAVASGQNVASRIRALVDRAVNASAERIMRDHIEPLRNFGVTTLADLSHKVAASGMPKYVKYKKEIDERLGQLSPELRANPEAIKMIHDAVVGSHADDIEREAAEAAVRKAQEPAATATPGTGAAPGTSRDKGDIPTLVDVGGQEGLEALKHKGRGGMNQDALAQSMGYKDWNDYQKQYQDLLNAEGQGNA